MFGMSRNALAVGAIVLVGALLWTVIAWPAPGDDAALEPLSFEEPAPTATAPPPAAAAPVAPAEEPAAVPPLQAAPATVEPPPLPAAEQAAPEQADMFAVVQGPADEYRRSYESEPRDSAASDVEATIRAAFSHPGDDAPGMFKSVLCRQTICRIELNYSEERMGAYVAGMTRATAAMDSNIAVAPLGPMRDAVRPIEVFIKRQSKEPAARVAEPPPAAPGQPAEAPAQAAEAPGQAAEGPARAAEAPGAAPGQPEAPPAAPPATTN